MRKNIIGFAILLVAIILNQAAFADVKIKTRQTMSGQSTESTTYIKGKRTRAEQNAGGMPTVTITQCDLKRSLRLMLQSQVYIVDAWQTTQNVAASSTTTQTKTKGGVVTSTITTKDTGERKQIFGYTARHIITTIETDSSPDACDRNKSKMEIDAWYIDAEFGEGDGCSGEPYPYQPPVKNGGCQDRYVSKQIGAAVKKGYPVSQKMTMFDDGGSASYTMQNEVVEISKVTLDAALFDVPAGYREVKDSTELYASMSQTSMNTQNSSNKNSRNNYSVDVPNSNNSTITANVKNDAQPTELIKTEVGEKKAGVVRIGFTNTKTGAVGEGLNAAELAGAVQNTLAEYLKSPNVELLALEAKLPSAIDAEARTKECDFIIYTNVSHKKGGGGGFGMFKKIAPSLGNVIPVAGAGSVAGMVAGQVTSTLIYTAAGMAANTKAKDEVSLDVKINSMSGAAVLAKQFKQKAKGDGDDIITPVVEQAAQTILDAIAKK